MEIHNSPGMRWPGTASILCGPAIVVAMGVALASCGGGASFSPRQLIAVSVQPSDAVAFFPAGTLPFSATGTFDSAPTTQTNLATQWASSDESIATVDSTTGIATCQALGGPITVAASATGKGGMVSGSATLTCISAPQSGNGHCLVNGSKLSGTCRINSCINVSDPVHCPAGQDAITPKITVGICIPGPVIPVTIDTSTACTQ
jgi:hypothetical protein